MALKKSDFLLDIWSFDKDGNKVHPYKGERGDKKDLYSINFTSDTNNYLGYSETQLIEAITSGKFKERGTIRMLPLNYKLGAERNAFGPKYYLGKHIKDFG